MRIFDITNRCDDDVLMPYDTAHIALSFYCQHLPIVCEFSWLNSEYADDYHIVCYVCSPVV